MAAHPRERVAQGRLHEQTAPPPLAASVPVDVAGLCLIEAMMLGMPVVAAAAPAHEPDRFPLALFLLRWDGLLTSIAG